jgi:ketosteroid isomerase-like protein
MSLANEKNSDDVAIRSQIDAVGNNDVEALLTRYGQDVVTFVRVVPPAPTDAEAIRKRLHELVRIVRDNRSTATSVT